MKSYTNIEQSKKLAEILPLESSDMEFMFLKTDGTMVSNVPFLKEETDEPDCSYKLVSCWSLAALRACLPSGINIDGTLYVFESHNTFDNEWVYGYKYEDNMAIYIKSKNDIDACYEMIIKLYEQNLLKN